MPVPKLQIGHWYDDVDEGNFFKVVSVDEDANTIVVEYYDGNVEELELVNWDSKRIEEIEEPEDLAGGLDDFEMEAFDDDTDLRPEEWDGSLNGLDVDD